MTQAGDVSAKAFETQITSLFASQGCQDNEQRMNFWKWVEQNPVTVPANLEDKVISLLIMECDDLIKSDQMSRFTAIFVKMQFERGAIPIQDLVKKIVELGRGFIFPSIITLLPSSQRVQVIKLTSEWVIEFNALQFLKSLGQSNKRFFLELLKFEPKSNDRQFSLLFKIFESGKIEMLEAARQILKEDRTEFLKVLKIPNKYGMTILHAAAEHGHMSMIYKVQEIFEEEQADFIQFLKKVDNENYTVLFTAASCNHIDVFDGVQKIFGEKNRAEFINLLKLVRNEDGSTILHMVVSVGNLKMLNKIREVFGEERKLEFLQFLKTTAEDGYSILHQAVNSGHISVIDEIQRFFDENRIEFITLVKKQTQEGETLLHFNSVEDNDAIEAVQKIFEDDIDKFINFLEMKKNDGDTFLNIDFYIEKTIKSLKNALSKYGPSSSKEKFLSKLELFPLLSSLKNLINMKLDQKVQEECERLFRLPAHGQLVALMLEDSTIGSYLKDVHPEILRHYFKLNPIEQLPLTTKLELLPFLLPEEILRATEEGISSTKSDLDNFLIDFEIKNGNYIEEHESTTLQALKQVHDSWLLSINWQDPSSYEQQTEAVQNVLAKIPFRLIAAAFREESMQSLVPSYLRVLPPFHLGVVIPQIDKKQLIQHLVALNEPTLNVAVLRCATREQLEEAAASLEALFPKPASFSGWKHRVIVLEALSKLYSVQPEKIGIALDECKTALASISGKHVESTLPIEFNCPISQDVMNEPVLAVDGQNYELDEILQALKYNGRSPVTRAELTENDLVKNLSLQSLIAATRSGEVNPTTEQIEAALKGEPWEHSPEDEKKREN